MRYHDRKLKEPIQRVRVLYAITTIYHFYFFLTFNYLFKNLQFNVNNIDLKVQGLF